MTLPPQAVAALNQGNKIEAIRIVREATGAGLKESKEAVEAYVATQPALQAKMAAAQERSRRTLAMWAAAVLGVALLAYLFLTR